MSTKKSSNQNSKLNWPKTEQRKIAEKLVRDELRQEQQNKLAVISQVTQLMTAASSIPSPHVTRLMQAAMKEAEQSPKLLEEKPKNSTKRTTDEHREEYFATNTAWDEVNGIRYHSLDLLRTVSAIPPLLRSKELLACVDNIRLLSRTVAALCRDTQTMATVLEKIYALHSTKTGGAVDPQEMMLSCEVYSQYVDFMERYDSAVMPILVHVGEQLQVALIKLDTINPEAAAELNNRLQSTLSNVRTIIHETTGGTDQVSPGAVPELTTPVATEEQAA